MCMACYYLLYGVSHPQNQGSEQGSCVLGSLMNTKPQRSFWYVCVCDVWYKMRMGNRMCLSLSLCGLGGLQHFAILLKYIIHVAIPDIPGWVAEEMAKLEYRRREAFKVSLYHSLKDLRQTACLKACCWLILCAFSFIKSVCLFVSFGLFVYNVKNCILV